MHTYIYINHMSTMIWFLFLVSFGFHYGSPTRTTFQENGKKKKGMEQEVFFEKDFVFRFPVSCLKKKELTRVPLFPLLSLPSYLVNHNNSPLYHIVHEQSIYSTSHPFHTYNDIPFIYSYFHIESFPSYSIDITYHISI